MTLSLPSQTVTARPLPAGNVMVAFTGELRVPSEFCAVKLKLCAQPSVAVHGAVSEAVKPPFASIRRVPPENVGAGDVTTVSGRPAASVQPDRTPGVLMARYVDVLAV